ncbi:flavin reductase family protein [Martelella sp. HB161492]|uniref:flavin reductase family protein n=1 Tax=Martelella sp. HB161492 TaxID=2720726 RepID=UPI001591E5D7|nr:flavin reductase family protein [Martelella sp. HB161492]
MRDTVQEKPAGDHRSSDPSGQSLELSFATPANAPVERQDFRDAMASLAASVCIVSARDEDARAGRTVTAVMSLTGTPPSVLVSIDRESLLAGMIRHSATFSLAVLARSQWTIADAFAGRIAAAHRFKCGRWDSWPSGNPKLAHAVTAMDCAVIGQIVTETHILFAGAIVGIERSARLSPLIWHDRGYHSAD